MVEMLHEKDRAFEFMGVEYKYCDKTDCDWNLNQNKFNDMLKMNTVSTKINFKGNICNCGETPKNLQIAAMNKCYPVSGIDEDKRRLYITMASGFDKKVRKIANYFENQGFDTLLIEPKYTNIRKIPTAEKNAMILNIFPKVLDELMELMQNNHYNHTSVDTETYYEEMVGYVVKLIDRKNRRTIVYPGIFHKSYNELLRNDDGYLYTWFEDGERFFTIRTPISWENIGYYAVKRST